MDGDITTNNLFFILGAMATHNRIKLMKNDKLRYANYFGITMAMSGSGKDLTLSVAESLVGINDKDENGKHYIESAYRANFESLNGLLPNGDKVNDEVDYIVPTQYKTALQGTKEGMMRVANFFNRCSVGSLNVISTEFGDELINSNTLPTLTTLWQDAKADGSTNVNEKYKPVSDVPTNVMLFGSPAPFIKDQKKHHILASAIESGLARRTFFVWKEHDKIKRFNDSFDEEQALAFGEELKLFMASKRDAIMVFSKEALERIDEYNEKLIEAYNEKQTEWNFIRTSNVDKIERLAAIISLTNMNQQIELSDINMAIEWSEKSDIAMKNIIQPRQEYLKMYELLISEKNGLTMTEIIEMGGINFRTKSEKETQLEYLEDYAYRKNKQLKKKGKHHYVLSELEETKLNKMIVSVSSNFAKDSKKEVKYKSLIIPFFGSKQSIETLVTAEDYHKSFLLAHFEPMKTDDEYGYRKADNFIPGENMIAFDIDDSLTLEEAKDRISQYQYIIYTTRNHRKEKNGLTCDRFRIIMPTKTMFYVTPEEHKQLYINMAEALGLEAFDTQTGNVSRMWFTNKEAEVIIKQDGELIDVRCCLPETEVSKSVMPNIEKLNNVEDMDEVERRIHGMQKFVLMNAIHGNRNQMIYRLAKFIHEIGGDMNIVNQTNAMISDPLPENEVRTILRNIR